MIKGTSLQFGPVTSVLVLGGGEFVIRFASIVREQGLDFRIVTSPRHAGDKTSNRTSFEAALKDHKIPHHITETIDDTKTREFIGDTSKTFCLSLGAAWIMRESIIEEVFKGFLFNAHGTRLPQNRGGASVSWQIMNGNCFGFNLLHLVDGGIDTGAIVRLEEFLYPSTCRTPADYMQVYRRNLEKFLEKFLIDAKKGEVCLSQLSQPEYLSTYWPRLNTLVHGVVDWSMPVAELERFIRAFDEPYQGASSFLEGNRVHFKSVQLNLQDGVFHPFQAGLIYRKGPSWICVACNGGALVLEKVTDGEGNSILEKLKIGDRFATPVEMIEASKSRVIYSATGMKVR